jgi:hypothetical protein
MRPSGLFSRVEGGTLGFKKIGGQTERPKKYKKKLFF